MNEPIQNSAFPQEIVQESRKMLTVFSSAEMEERLLVHKLHSLEQLFSETELQAQSEFTPSASECFTRQIETRKHQPFGVMVKRHSGTIPLIPLTELKNGLYKIPLPVREWEAIADLEGLGLNLPERLALFHSRERQFQSALITKAIPAQQSIYQMMCNRSWNSLGEEMQSGILDQLIANLFAIHEDGYCWQKVSLENFHPVLQGNGEWMLWLTNLESAVADLPEKMQQRDLNHLLKTASKMQADPFTLKYLKQKWHDRHELALNSAKIYEQAQAA